MPAGLLLLCACFSDIDELAEKARQGDPQAQRDLAYDLSCKGEMENAFHRYRKAAEAGDANAMCNLGTMYLTGRGTSVNQENAVKWLKRAAEQNDANAMLKLAGLYQNGEGVTQNHKEALKWIRKAVRRAASMPLQVWDTVTKKDSALREMKKKHWPVTVSRRKREMRRHNTTSELIICQM
ncbi:MAG: tetratricopeptide repeat protein [Victivallales bacterium]